MYSKYPQIYIWEILRIITPDEETFCSKTEHFTPLSLKKKENTKQNPLNRFITHFDGTFKNPYPIKTPLICYERMRRRKGRSAPADPARRDADGRRRHGSNGDRPVHPKQPSRMRNDAAYNGYTKTTFLKRRSERGDM